MDDLLAEFLAETAEGLMSLDVDLVQFEHNPEDKALLGKIFRIVHTIKGTCGFFALPRLERVAHACENVLGRVRDGEHVITPSAVSLILTAMDRIRLILNALENTGVEPIGDDVVLIEQLTAEAEGRATLKAAEPRAALIAPVMLIESSAAVVTPAATEPKSLELAPLMEAEAALREILANENAGDTRETATANANIRVSLEVIESMMTTVSELVLTRNQLMQMLRSQKDSEFAPPLQRLSHLTTELQESVMKVRMQPIHTAWTKFPRLVRELSIELGKKIDLRMSGSETELDRQVLDLIKDPLTHMVRNSADHGIEMPEQRVAAGKPEHGTIVLNACHDSGQIVIEISDDGRGLNTDGIRRKALENRLATEAELTAMSESQIHQFILRPGFSTATAVTSVSGRGVGMDVVNSNIEKIGGSLELKSVAGEGSTIIIKIPLTLAIVSVLIVECEGERFAIPQAVVSELVRPSGRSETRIDTMNGTPVLRLRDHLVPLITLQKLLGFGDRVEPLDNAYIVIAQLGSKSFGIVVDRVFDTEEIVVKPVARVLRHIQMYSGTTILGDGTVIMILDPNGVAGAVGLLGREETRRFDHGANTYEPESSKISFLLFRAGSDAPKATPLSQVARLEEIDAASIEITNGRPVVQYRGKLMPLITLDESPIKTFGVHPILVFSDEQHAMGLIVDKIIDIVDDEWNVQLGSAQPGVMGSAVIAGAATDLIDISHYLQLAYVDWFGPSPAARSELVPQKKNILLVDDSALFRNLAIPVLRVAGYAVWSADSADRAIKLCESGIDFDAIITDIEMPNLTGFELAAHLRSIKQWADIPLIALTAHVGPRDLERGKTFGFSDFIPKFDRERLLTALSNVLHGSSAYADPLPEMEAA